MNKRIDEEEANMNREILVMQNVNSPVPTNLIYYLEVYLVIMISSLIFLTALVT